MISTYILDDEKTIYTRVQDEELNKLLQDVRAACPKFLLREEPVSAAGFFRPKNQVMLYTLYVDAGHEAQVFNFHPEGAGSSIHTMVTKATIANYFYGVLAGLNCAPKPRPHEKG